MPPRGSSLGPDPPGAALSEELGESVSPGAPLAEAPDDAEASVDDEAPVEAEAPVAAPPAVGTDVAGVPSAFAWVLPAVPVGSGDEPQPAASAATVAMATAALRRRT